MADNVKNVAQELPDNRQAMKDFDKLAKELRKQIKETRKGGIGIMTPGLINKHLHNGQELVLQYGKQGHKLTYTLADLKAFADNIRTASKKFRQDTRGVPLAQLEASSLPKDKERARQVKGARLYKLNQGLLFFTVTGNEQPFYQVRIRLEDWAKAVAGDVWANPLSAAKQVAMGKLSIDCQCGRHQYWYRYLANIGNYDVNPPKEMGYPKIRNPRLTGCCCKHVLKVLGLLKSNTIHTVLAKYIEKARDNPAFASGKTKFLTDDELKKLRNVRGVFSRTPKEAKKALKEFLRGVRSRLTKAASTDTAQKKREQLKPRKAQKSVQPPKQTKEAKKLEMPKQEYKLFVDGLRTMMGLVKQGIMPREMVGTANAQNALGKKYGLNAQDVEDIIKKENLDG